MNECWPLAFPVSFGIKVCLRWHAHPFLGVVIVQVMGTVKGGTQSVRKGCETGKNFRLPINNTRCLKYFRKKRQAIILIPLVK